MARSFEQDQNGPYMMAKGPLLCRAEGCDFLAATGTRGVGNEPDSPGLCIFHSAISERPDCWGNATHLLHNKNFLRVLWYVQQLAKFPIDRDETRNPRTGKLWPASKWAQLRFSDTNYLTMHLHDALVGAGLKDIERRGKEEAPRQFALRVYAGLIAAVAAKAVPVDSVIDPGCGDDAGECPELAAFVNKCKQRSWHTAA